MAARKIVRRLAARLVANNPLPRLLMLNEHVGMQQFIVIRGPLSVGSSGRLRRSWRDYHTPVSPRARKNADAVHPAWPLADSTSVAGCNYSQDSSRAARYEVDDR